MITQTKYLPKFPNTSFLSVESKCFNIDWLYIVADCSEQKILTFLSKSVQFEYRNLVLNFLKMEHGTQHFKNKTIVTLFGMELFHIESSPNPKNVAFKQNQIRIRVSNEVFYSKHLIFCIKALFSTHLLSIANYYISEMHIALDGANYLYNFLCLMSKGENYTMAYLPKTENGYGRKFNANVFNSETGNFLGFTIGSKNNDLWLSCYNKISDLELKDKSWIKQYWRDNQINYTKYPAFYRFEIRMSRGLLKTYIKDNTLEILERKYFCSLFKTIFNERLKFTAIIKKQNDFKMSILDTKTINYTKFDPMQSDKKYKEYFGHWVSQWFHFTIKQTDATGNKVSFEFIESQVTTMIHYCLNFNLYNINYLHETLKKRVKRFPIKKIKPVAIKIQEIMLNIYQNLEIDGQYKYYENLELI